MIRNNPFNPNKKILATTAIALIFLAGNITVVPAMNQQAAATTDPWVAQISGGGEGMLFCNDGRQIRIGSSFNGALNSDGSFASGGFFLQTLDGTEKRISGNDVSGSITTTRFTINGEAVSDDICSSSMPSSVVLSGPCGNNVPIQFNADNGLHAEIIGNVLCMVEQCSDSIDNDGDGLIDENCATPPEVKEVNIDVQPEDDEISTINLRSQGVIMVAVLGSDDFDISEVDVSTIDFEGAQPTSTRQRLEDVNGDGILDLLVRFESQDIEDLQEGDTEACLTGELNDETTEFQGCDEVRVIEDVAADAGEEDEDGGGGGEEIETVEEEEAVEGIEVAE